jgi:hypothetical protein
VHAASVAIAMAAGMITNCRISHFLYEAMMMLAQLHASSQSAAPLFVQVRFAGLPQSTST